MFFGYPLVVALTNNLRQPIGHLSCKDENCKSESLFQWGANRSPSMHLKIIDRKERRYIQIQHPSSCWDQLHSRNIQDWASLSFATYGPKNIWMVGVLQFLMSMTKVSLKMSW